MTILVVDVAAEYGGALSVLNEYMNYYRNDKDNRYYVFVSNANYENCENVTVCKCAWVKKSFLHRAYFDLLYIKRQIKLIKPDKVISLQNIAVMMRRLKQEVLFQNALPISERRFSFSESRYFWLYQNIIGTLIRFSFNFADTITVQAEWIKKSLIEKWKIDGNRIIVNKPEIHRDYYEHKDEASYNANGVINLFYPAGPALYKNHKTLIEACIKLWQEGNNNIRLVITADKDRLPDDLRRRITPYLKYIDFVGSLKRCEMIEYYKKSFLVFPSYLETIGLPLIEAKTIGAYIISSDMEFAHGALENYQKVEYIDPFDSSDIYAGIKKTIDKIV